jgi:transcription-repair coupling factor (superfamily II helicase)
LRPVEGASKEYEHERLKILGRMAAGNYSAVITCADAALQLTMPKDIYDEYSVEIKEGAEMPVEKAVGALVRAGYARFEQVDGMGQFALRGGILDFFPPYAENPVRVEFWGDEPESVSFFDAATQRRTDNIRSALITPVVEVDFGSDERLTETIKGFIPTIKTKTGQKAAASFQRDIERLKAGIKLPSADRYLPLCYKKPGTLFDYAGGALLFVSDPTRVRERAKNTLWQHGADLETLFEDGALCRGLDKYYLEMPDFGAAFDGFGAIFLDTFARSSYDTRIKELISFPARQLAVWGGGFKLLCEDLEAVLSKSGSAAILAGTQRACGSLVHDLVSEGIAAYAGTEKSDPPPPGKVLVLPGRLSAGFEYPTAGFTLITHGTPPGGAVRKRERKAKQGAGIHSLSELSPGDYVVHTAHGIGVYEGINKLQVQGIVKDYIKIRYAGKDTLYVPVTQLDLVSKYIGRSEDGRIRLSKMGGAEWQKAKTRVRAAVRDMAKELIALYAARQKIKGYPFPEDNEWQREFEERFEFEETEDQLRCTTEIKFDMERPFPMDRLLCGDVGFGKTEVALRAAFKCVLSGRQCAMLVPTTILAWQHYQTVLKRLGGFPVKCELLSRFRTPRQQEQIIKKLARGEIDVVIGTHRLVQKDVRFRSLGLVIVDEEQRFGVAQKEKLKELFKTVDVLTLSATPIPRTLNMALSGIRDMSVIEEAPQDRHPVQTYILEHDWGVVADAIKKELGRAGQVYYLHNRIETISSAAQKLGLLLPDARIGVAHGKMNEEDLSTVWGKLLDNEIDILVCTTIIETGVDVPNVNTLIIEDADKMGLSQLHQIRGRVGRSPRRAVAYLTFRRGKALSDTATKRLSAIREFTEFGSGFQVALRDLEIRGAGNILGAQQHGHLEAVGYDMYLKLLNDAVLEEKGETPEIEAECMVDIQISAHIPDGYIDSPGQRLAIYRRIADVRSQEDASDVVDELIDRFGEPPDQLKSLIDVALLRNTAASLGIREISQRDNLVMLFSDRMDFKAVSYLVTSLRGRVMVNAGARPYISVKLLPGQSPVEAIRESLMALRTGGGVS